MPTTLKEVATRSGAMLACKDCSWCIVYQDGPTCTHPQSFHTQTDFYTGVTRSVAYDDQGMRTIGPCKPAALFFHPKPSSTRGLSNRLRRA